MSTILNALKRLENEERSVAGDQIPAAMSGRAGVPGKKRRLRLVLILAAVAMLAGAAVFWGSLDRFSEEDPSLEAARPEPPVAAAARESTRESLRAAPIPGGRHPQAASKTRPRQLSKSATHALVNARGDVTAPNYRPPDPEGQKIRARPPEPLPEAPAPALPRPSPAAPPSAPQDAYARAEVLPKDTLQLQAISWSEIPGERITIITGQILREGQTIDGYSVIAIRPDDVILEKAGKWWKLVYGSN